jgi:hypothetical protein
MRKIVIDGAEYDIEFLSEDGLAQLESLKFLEAQLKKLENEMNVYQAARSSYLQSLKNEIERSGLRPIEAGSSSE